MNLDERIQLTRQTLDALERVEANKGNVPDGFVLEYYDETDNSWGRSGLNDGSEQRFVMYYRLRSTTPRQIPLGPEDRFDRRVYQEGWIGVWAKAEIPAIPDISGIQYTKGE